MGTIAERQMENLHHLLCNLWRAGLRVERHIATSLRFVGEKRLLNHSGKTLTLISSTPFFHSRISDLAQMPWNSNIPKASFHTTKHLQPSNHFMSARWITSSGGYRVSMLNTWRHAGYEERITSKRILTFLLICGYFETSTRIIILG